MCQQTAYLMRNGEKERIMESVVEVRSVGPDVSIVNVFGEKKTIHGAIYALALNDGEVLLKEH